MIQFASWGLWNTRSFTIKDLFQTLGAGRFDDFGLGLLEPAPGSGAWKRRLEAVH
jgi:hypothetical protein